jgi:hypothetical protein
MKSKNENNTTLKATRRWITSIKTIDMGLWVHMIYLSLTPIMMVKY